MRHCLARGMDAGSAADDSTKRCLAADAMSAPTVLAGSVCDGRAGWGVQWNGAAGRPPVAGAAEWGAHLAASTQSSGLESSASSISSGGLKAGSKSSKMLPLFLLSPSISTSYLSEGQPTVEPARRGWKGEHSTHSRDSSMDGCCIGESKAGSSHQVRSTSLASQQAGLRQATHSAATCSGIAASGGNL